MTMRTPEHRITAYRRSLGGLATALFCIGCAAPAAPESSTPSLSAAVTSATESATAAPTPPATYQPSATPAPAPTLAVEPPDGLLPPNSIVVAVVDGLQLRAGPGLGADVTGRAMAGEQFKVAGWFGPVVSDGLDWYRLGPATVGDLDAWAAAGADADRYLEVVPPSCPSGDPDLAKLNDMAAEWDRLACFGDRSLSLEGTLGCGVCDGAIPGDFAPLWLAHPLGGLSLWADFQAGVGRLPMRAPPNFQVPEFGSIVRVTGHFSDPASTSCTISTFVGEQVLAVDQKSAELYCREQFVVDAMQVIGTDPNYSDPYGG
jgi:hypothetical protein